MSNLRILILGGYGAFGGRLMRLLAEEQKLTLICAGRSLQKAEAFIADLPASAQMIAAEIDRNGTLAADLSEWQPDLIVDASGPFQVYGDAPYRVVEAAIEAGIDYVDIGDGAEFVAGITAFDAQAKAAGISALSGASTYPALSAAVVRALSDGWQSVERIESGLAPSPRAGLGRNVIEAIMSYAGKPVPIIRKGRAETAPALIDSRRFVVAPPGTEPLPPMRFSLVELPDQTLFPSVWPSLKELWPGVGTRPQFMLRLLNLSAMAVRWRLLRSLSPFAGLAYWVMRKMPWGAHRGGLILRVAGKDANSQPIEREWHMIAEGDDGPFIPAMAVAALVRQRLDGKKPALGARPALDENTLDDFEAQFAAKEIAAGIRQDMPKDAPLYHHVLGDAFFRLPPLIRAMHTDPDGRVVKGRARVDRGGNPLARLVAALFGFPKASDDVPVEVRFTLRDGGELWERSFDGKPFSSFQKRGTGSFEHVLSERFGPLEFGLALILKDDQLWLKTIGWRAFGIPMPRFLAPSGDAFEHVEDGRFHFHVEIRHWLTGLIVRYRGWLE